MEVDKNEWKVLRDALGDWERTGKMTPRQAEELRKSISLKRTDRHHVAQYFFFIALFCTLLAFGAIFLNEKLLERLKAYFSLSDLVISAVTATLSIIWFLYVGRRRQRLSVVSYEINMILGALSTLTSLVYLCKQVGADKTHVLFLSLSVVALSLLGVKLRSRALWIGAIGAFVSWFWSFSTWLSVDNLFLGMNYPMRFMVLGSLILALSRAMKSNARWHFLQPVTYFAGMLLFFLAFWAVSIFGNYNTLAGWQQVRQVHVLAYSILFGAVTAGAFYLGIRYKDEVARDFAVLFLLVNLYTRYFEYFWDSMNKGIFFLVLAVTFGLLGRWLERKKHPRLERDKGGVVGNY
jgi:hypothetical protein